MTLLILIFNVVDLVHAYMKKTMMGDLEGCEENSFVV